MNHKQIYKTHLNRIGYICDLTMAYNLYKGPVPLNALVNLAFFFTRQIFITYIS